MARATKDPEAAASARWPVTLICGDDEFSVKQRARKIWESWSAEVGGMDHEVLEASAGSVDEALTRLRRLREALNTLPFFGGEKLIWFRDCTFLGEDRTGQSATVTEALGELAEQWKTFRWSGLRLLISASKPDKRRVFFKALDKQAEVEFYGSLAEEKDWADRVEAEALKQFRAARKSIADEALAEFVSRVGPNLRTLHNEVEKLILHSGDQPEITLSAVQLLTPLQKLAEGFALGEAVGERDLVRALHVLDEELWTIRTGADKKRSEIGLVYGLISKMRLLLLVKELRRTGQLRPARDYNSFRSQVSLIDASQLPTDKRFNPLAGHPFPVFQALKQVDRWEPPDLIRAMDLLLEANVQLVASGLDEAVVLQRTLIEIIGPNKAASRN
ncbi:MAG: DNA polymerase III subunit delta [Verrucomicrobia bacterium]|nr:DNA polymerase III subunit delta [Verrucomicrobiota bacterium]